MSEVTPTATPPSGKEASLSEAHKAQTDSFTVHTISHGVVTYSRQEERKLVRKIDFTVIPILLVLYLLLAQDFFGENMRHVTTECPKMICNNCNRKGHFTHSCPAKGKKATTSQAQGSKEYVDLDNMPQVAPLPVKAYNAVNAVWDNAVQAGQAQSKSGGKNAQGSKNNASQAQ